MAIEYLEIVTPNPDITVKTLMASAGLSFSAPIEELGGSQTASLANGGRIGVRAPMTESEAPAVRTYFLTENIEASTAAAVAEGAELAHPPLEIPGQGIFSIFFQDGHQFGFWQKLD